MICAVFGFGSVRVDLTLVYPYNVEAIFCLMGFGQSMGLIARRGHSGCGNV